MVWGGVASPLFEYCICLTSLTRAGDRDRPPQCTPQCTPPAIWPRSRPKGIKLDNLGAPDDRTSNSQRTPTATHSHRTVNTRSTHGQHTVNIRSTRRSTSRGLSEKRQAGVKMVVWGGDGKPAF